MSENHELMAVVELAAQLYNNELLRGSGVDRDRARGYVGARRLFAPMIERYRIGYVPKGQRRPWLLDKIGERRLLMAAGLINEGEDGRLYDPMEGRLVFPQVNPSGKYLGFVGRALTGDAPDKYLSTGVTPVFRRQEVLYRIDKARRGIEATRTAIVVEGLLDAVLMAQVGVKNVVATGTKSMSDPQAQILSRYAKRLEVMFDNEAEARKSFDELRRRRGQYFENVSWREYPAKFNDPADWVAAQIDRAITQQGAAVAV